MLSHAPCFLLLNCHSVLEAVRERQVGEKWNHEWQLVCQFWSVYCHLVNMTKHSNKWTPVLLFLYINRHHANQLKSVESASVSSVILWPTPTGWTFIATQGIYNWSYSWRPIFASSTTWISGHQSKWKLRAWLEASSLVWTRHKVFCTWVIKNTQGFVCSFMRTACGPGFTVYSTFFSRFYLMECGVITTTDTLCGLQMSCTHAWHSSHAIIYRW
jgi:hypothetical protein